MRLVSVNVGNPTLVLLNGKTRNTAIGKQPTATQTTVTTLGLAGDGVADSKHHGGVDQAVYAYSTEEYAWWSSVLETELPPGAFGENLTIDSFASSDLEIGDRFVFEHGCVLEITSPRIPCGTLAARMSDVRFSAAFAKAERPGPYLRVVAEGTVTSGETLELMRMGSGYPMVDLMRLFYARSPSQCEIARALSVPISTRDRERLARQLEVV